MSGTTSVSLEKAKSELLTSSTISNIEDALASVSKASADLELRVFLQDAALFDRLLDLYATAYATNQPPRDLLRCIGNLVSDNETNRSALIHKAECVENLKALLTDYSPGQASTYLEDFAIKIFFNLCNDAPETQKLAFGQGVHVAVIHYLRARTWNEEDETLVGIAAGLLANLLEHKNSIQPSEKYSAGSINQILHLPFLQFLDADAFLDILSVVCFYTQDEGFVLETVQSKQIHLVWNILTLTEDTMRRECGDDVDIDEDDRKQYQNLLNAFAQCLADLSSLPAFNEKYAVDDHFIQDLGKKCISLEDQKQQISLAPGCACLILGNLAISDEVSSALVPDVISTEKLLQRLSTSTDSVFLNAAAGLLRHLAIPVKNRKTCFGNPQHLRHVAHLYRDVTLEQVQIAGLQLTRQIITGVPERAERLIGQREPSGLPSLEEFLILFGETTSTATKLEIARITATILRSLQSPSNPRAYDACLQAMVKVPSILSPLVFAIKQAQAPGVLHAQADAWLALNLLARVSGGPALIARETSRDGDMLSILRQRIAKTGDSAVGLTQGEDAAAAEIQDARPGWVKEKERENAILLIHDIMWAEDVEDSVRIGLATLLEEGEIRMRKAEV